MGIAAKTPPPNPIACKFPYSVLMMVQVAPSFENMILLEDLEEETATNMASPYAMAVHMSFFRTCNVHLMPS